MYTFNWSFPRITVVNSGVDTYTDYVKEVSAAREAYISTDSGVYMGNAQIDIEIPDPTPETYVKFEDLTKDILVGWTSSYVGVSTIESMTNTAIERVLQTFTQNTTHSFISTAFGNNYPNLNPNKPSFSSP